MPQPITYNEPVDTRSQWVSQLCSWLWFNVVLGGLAILLSVIVWLPFINEHQFPSETTLGLIVLGITIAATNTDFPTALRPSYRELMTWLPRGAWAITCVGIVATMLTALRPYIGRTLVSPTLELVISGGILLSAILLGVAGFVVKTKASDAHFLRLIAEARGGEGYAADVNEAGARIADQAKLATDYDGTKI